MQLVSLEPPSESPQPEQAALPCLPAPSRPPMALPCTLDPLLVQRLPEVLYLVGTAHVSKKSADLAYHVVRAARPDAVVVELCWDRSQVRSGGREGEREGGEGPP